MFFRSRKAARQARLKARYEQEDIELFRARLTSIIRVADRNMKKAQYGSVFPVRDDVVVPIDDLLKIWDISHRVLSDTPVHGK